MAPQAKDDSVSFLQGEDAFLTYQSTGVAIDPNRHEGTKLAFSLEQTDGVFGLILLCFVFFAHSYNGGIEFMKENFSLIFSANKGKRLQRETTFKENFVTAFLVLQTFILGAICLYNFFVESKLPTISTLSPFVSILSFVTAIGIFMLLKMYFYKLLGYIFDMKDVADIWIQTNIVIAQILGILYFIPTLLLVYADIWHPQIVIFMLILFLIAQIILFYRIIVFFIREKFSFLFLIAYLCTAEILPYIFLAAGLAQLYQKDIFSIISWH